MEPVDLAVLHPDDVDPHEAEALARALANDPEARALAELARTLPSELKVERWEGGPSAADVLAAARNPAPVPAPANRRWIWAASASLALAAAVLVVVALPRGEPTRERGLGASPFAGEVLLEAGAEGSDGVRALRPGDQVGRDERVVFRIETSAAGYLELDELPDRRVYPVPGSVWQVQAGRHRVGSGSTLSYRPDARTGTLVYRVQLCTEPPTAARRTCAQDHFSLSWDP